MTRKMSLLSLIWASLLCMCVGRRGEAAFIDFNAEAANAPSTFTGAGSPLTIGIATFSGGQLLNRQVGGVDQTGVYATAGSNFIVNQILITFTQPVSQVGLQITNNEAGTYDLRDNHLDTTRLTLLANQTTTFTVPGTGLSSLMVLDYSALTGGGYSFSIDNLSFTYAGEPTAAVPEPSSLAMSGVALCGLGAWARRRRSA